MRAPMDAVATFLARSRIARRVEGRALVVAARARGLRLDAASRDPERVQRATLGSLVGRARDTAFGRAHGFDRIRDLETFRAHVPLRVYAELTPWLERAASGEPDVIWPGRIPYFGMSSGTTAGNKYLPISMDAVRRQRRHGFDPVAAYLRWTGDTGLMHGVAIMLGGSSALERRPSGVLVGDNTGVMARHVPRLLEPRYRPSARVRAIADWDRKIDALVAETALEDVRLIAGTPSWFPGLFDRLLEHVRRARPEVASVREVWPNLRLLTGGGINYEPYRPLVESRIGASVPYVDVYNATEGGIMGVQDRRDDRAMRLLPDNGVFYEFVPREDVGLPNARRHALWEVVPGVTYAIYVSTPSGLFGYGIGDCIRFVETFPHRFVFEGRTAAFLNLTGEHVSQGELERAMRTSADALRLEVADFCVIPEVGLAGGGARHVWLVEPASAPESLDLERFARLVDEDVLRRNGDYEAHRGSPLGLRAPVVRLVPRGTFEAYMRARGKWGAQNKVPRVLDHPEHVSLLLRCAGLGGPAGERCGARSAPG
jgi:hypothetical protein